ncbi:hypothetical protein [Mycoplasma todarodis]|uniref:DUF4268 domain-containing protein n=1 Tax=Mycoplasma todarodis TaxID=1937191 RepID=A0A4R0XU73_9MOLU|nr:hypothetical protein [Mycoplasma todarodis]TCG12088.1 hypothetical protein C4B25_00135 [Mycoplasma todarodis]
MKNIKFTKIEKHNLKSIFGNEPQFTKWFEEEGKNYIEETLRIALKDIHTEQPVGNYYLDVYAKIDGTNDGVIIENQYGTQDHKHLGQLLTYAAGLSTSESNVKYIIWIAENSRSEAVAAIDWLNKISGEQINFIVLVPNIISIGEGEKAFYFDIVTQANDFEKVASAYQSKELSERNKEYLDFWTKFDKWNKNNGLNVGKAIPEQYRYIYTPNNIRRYIELRGRENTFAVKFVSYTKEEHISLQDNVDKICELLGVEENQIQFVSLNNKTEWGFALLSKYQYPKETTKGFEFWKEMINKIDLVKKWVDSL